MKMNAFLTFTSRYGRKIDMSILKFFNRKKRDSGDDFARGIYDALEEFCLREGKRIRPLLLLSSYLGYEGGKARFADVLDIAAMVEMMHSFLLVHDDIIDKSSVRRGRDSLHVVFQKKYRTMAAVDSTGSDVALVAGDMLYFNAIEMIARVRFNQKIKDAFLMMFSRTYEMTSIGQIMDVLHSLSSSIDEKESRAMLIGTYKTAYYTIYYPMAMGYILAGMDDKNELARIKKFALSLGLAFQIRDDVLGVFGAENKTGKSSDSDLKEGKLTILIENTMKNLTPLKKKEFNKLFFKKNKSSDDIKRLKRIIKQSGAFDKALLAIRELTVRSEKEMTRLSMSGSMLKVLTGLIEIVSGVEPLSETRGK
jgi:geranylgeranyl diphosphate synthase, type I